MIVTDAMRRFIDAHRVARLATVDGDWQPHVVPFCYALVDVDLYFIVDDKPKRTHRGLKRLQNLHDNPRVAIVIDDYQEDWTQLAYLMLQGQAALVDDAELFERVLCALRQRYSQYRDMALGFATHPLVRLRIERATFWRASGG